MKCLILAAGYATRLYPLTENFPKPLLDVGGKTILDHLVDDISGAEEGDCGGTVVDEFVVISNHKFAGHFERWAGSKPQKITVVDDGTSTNETRLGAVRDIKFAIDSLGLDDDFLVIAGDNVLDFSLRRFLEYAAAKGTSCIMRYAENDDAHLRKCGVVCIDADEKVTHMEEKPALPKSRWCCPPFYVLTRADAARIGEAIASGCGTDAPGSLAAWLSANSTVHAMEMPGCRFDVGNLESYNKIRDTYSGIRRN